ncbi:YhhA family cyclophane-containing RiPP [Blastomonas aquatica]|uniref:YhhA family cyclophane-containing RiPP n=1 Tax=Blastomonas aquatica TaxID=1510276 RepID=UPI003570B8DF
MAAVDIEHVRVSLLKSKTVNPALQRLQARIATGAKASELITSYDRMHHRHNRS